MDNGKSKRITKRIKVYGIVQGVGFRPLVYRMAKKLEIAGTVRNVGGYVEIDVQAEQERISSFIQELMTDKSSGYEIVNLEAEDLPWMKYEDFLILGSGESEEVSIVPPDLPICSGCQEELYQESDRRYRNPFISCMSCGPRYTIIEELPYDRHTTTMKDFDMCDSCREEYTSPKDRRFHAQTISCNDCGPYLIYRDNANKKDKIDYGTEKNSTEQDQDSLYEKEAFAKAVTILKAGGIIAVKGIGGYHLVCSPFSEETVQNLRRLKGREEKPFAVMFETIASIKEYCLVSKEEKALLETKARPIVLLYLHKDAMAPSTNKGSMYCGAFLPYTPLQLLLIRNCGPLIMTSANLSDQPIIREDKVMLSLKSPYLDGVLYNTRRIVRSVDDSVAKIIDGKPQLIRRSRGYVPYPVFLSQPLKNVIYDSASDRIQQKDKDNFRESNTDIHIKHEVHNPQDNDTKGQHEPRIFAAGGDLKSAFCLYRGGNAYVSQHFGDLEEVTVFEDYKKAYQDLSGLLKIKPTCAVCDLHPNYYSAEFTKSLGIPLLQVQHHHAHAASVMAEHDLKGEVIGIAFDGTGYGTDGSIWGGEFLICEGADFVRAGHLKNTPMLGGDESMRDAAKTAACFLLEAGLEEYVTDSRKDIVKAALLHKVNTIMNSSMGRLFDAVASILEIRQVNRYEGECAAFLEREAVLAQRTGKEPVELSFTIRKENESIIIDPTPVLEKLCRLRKASDTGSLALGFHYALTEAVAEVCRSLRTGYGTNMVALSGGVFQNTVLSERTLKVLRENGFEVYVNLAVPPNDGAISLGQTYVALKKLSI